MVQHYFRTRDEMMTFALAVVRRAQRGPGDPGGRGARPDAATPRTLLRTMLAELLPLDEERRADGRVALAFLAYTAVRPTVAAALHDETAALLAFIAGQIRLAQAAGTANRWTRSGPRSGCWRCMEGLGIYLLGGHYPPETALAALDAQLDLIFGPRAACLTRDRSVSPAGSGRQRPRSTIRQRSST